MHQSICIKTNNKAVIDYLLKKLSSDCYIYSDTLYSVYVSKNKFKIYNNIIIHFKGDKQYLDNFLYVITNIITDTIIQFYEKKWIDRLININYFYFNENEIQSIISIYKEIVKSLEFSKSNISLNIDKYNLINEQVFNYLKNNNKIILDGFVNFRLSEYVKLLDYTIDIAVNKFIIEREYIEFIKLVKLYIHQNPSNADTIHLIYDNNTSILLDEKQEIIPLSDELMNTKFVSDIVFSNNDHTLNTLINILPQKIYLHLLYEEDDFTNTLINIFGDRILICSDCNICKFYKKINKTLPLIE